MSLVSFEYLSHFYHTKRKFVQSHNHSCYELVYYLDGTGETAINGKLIHRYRPLTYALYKPYDFHTETHETASSVYCLGFYLGPECPFEPESGLYEDADHTVWGLIEKLSEEIAQKRDHYNIAAELYTGELLLNHQRNFGEKQRNFSSLNYIFRFLDENFAQDISLQTLVDMSGYSYDYFRHIFREAVGISPKNYILEKRITYARKLLIEKKLPMSEIAQLCGFSSASQFNVIFKKRMGISPLQYKKLYKNYQENVANLAGDFEVAPEEM